MTGGLGHHLVLVGMMGVGKTTIGRRVAESLGRPFLDSDAEVERRTGRTVAAIFDADGEPAFRAVEAEVLLDALSSAEPAVIAAAGGTVLSETNRVALRQAGTVVWLRAPVPVLAERVVGSTHRPALADDPEGTLDSLSSGRDVLYREIADLSVDATRPIDAVVEQVLLAAAQALPPTEHALMGRPQAGEPTHVRKNEHVGAGERGPRGTGTGTGS